MIPLVVAFLLGVATTLLVVLYFRRTRHASVGSEKSYLTQLRSLLGEMPFIFRDVSLTVLQDYVQVEHDQLNFLNFEPKSTGVRDATLESALRRNRRVLIVGAAGVGKTTFQRFSILKIIDDPSTATFLNPDERPIPVFVPLKAVDNSQPSPIFRYITAIPFFSGESGKRKLLKGALEGRLLLCLDGYDEISFLGGPRNFVKEELNSILRPVSGINKSDILSDAHRALARARIWISSRREFYLLNPIDALALTVPPALAVQFRGVGNNRARLVSNIFIKYAAAQKGRRIDLDAEYFLSQIGASGDPELIELSHNPLFLTVMCYIYAQKVTDTGLHDVPWLSNMNALITTCVSLLVRDLDENKARDLPEARRAALLRRRNAYTFEKQQFLRYFSAYLVLNEIPLFTLDTLKNEVRKFFENANDTTARTIIDELQNDNAGNPHFALQLIYCGVFVIVAVQGTVNLYDFPHRRFREVLAAEHIDHEEYLLLLSKLGSKGFSEFMDVFRKSRNYNDPEFHKSAFKRILELADSGADSSYMLRVTRAFITEKPSQVDVSEMFWEFVRDKLRAPEPSFWLSTSLVQAMPVPTDVPPLAQQTASNAVSVGAHLSLLLALKLLALADKNSALVLGARFLAASSLRAGIAAAILSLYVECMERIPEKLFSYLTVDPKARDSMLFALIRKWKIIHAEDRTRIVLSISTLPEQEKDRILIRFMGLGEDVNDIATSYRSRLRISLVRDAVNLSSERSFDKVNPPFYFITDGHFSKVISELEAGVATGRWIMTTRSQTPQYAHVIQPQWRTILEKVTQTLEAVRERLLTSAKNDLVLIVRVRHLLENFLLGQKFSTSNEQHSDVLKVEPFLCSVDAAIKSSNWSLEEIQNIANLAAYEQHRAKEWPEFFS
jgi:hypothetical protein